MEAEGFGEGCVVAAAFGNVQVAGRLRRGLSYVRLRGWLLALAACAVTAEVTACSLAGAPASTLAERSLQQIRVSGYKEAGESAAFNPGTTSSSAVYVGPPAADSHLMSIVTGPDVSVTIFRTPSPHVVVLPTDNIIWVGRGHAPLKCGLLIYRYRKGKRASDWWRVTDSQLTQVSMGRLSIFEITVTCGKG